MEPFFMIAFPSMQDVIHRITVPICRGVLSCFLASFCHVATAQLVMPQLMPNTAPAAEEVFEEEIVPKHYIDHPAVKAFIDKMVARYDFNQQALQALFAQVDYSATAVE